MKALLTGGLCGWPADRVEVLEDAAAPHELATRLVKLTEDVEDVLLVYYVGHGMRIPNGQLALALRDTSSSRPLLRHTAMVYRDVAEILRGCPAATKLVILDCCHAELGNRVTYQFQSADIDAEPVDGLYCIWASKEWEAAKSPLTGRLTYFTGMFIRVVSTGIPGKPPQLTIDQIFTELRARLLLAGLPEPAQSGIRDAHHWPFALNAAQPETHRDPDREIAQLLKWKAAAEGREQALQAQIAEHVRELESLRKLASSLDRTTTQEKEELQNAVNATERRVDDLVAVAEADTWADPPVPAPPNASPLAGPRGHPPAEGSGSAPLPDSRMRPESKADQPTLADVKPAVARVRYMKAPAGTVGLTRQPALTPVNASPTTPTGAKPAVTRIRDRTGPTRPGASRWQSALTPVNAAPTTPTDAKIVIGALITVLLTSAILIDLLVGSGLVSVIVAVVGLAIIILFVRISRL